jgi:2-aminobenzoylacetyl-CoA thioesterase
MFIKSLTENLYILGHPYFHVYLIKGKRASALVEMGISATANDILGQLASMDVRPDYLIVTHPHSDHICGLDALKQCFPNAVVMAGLGAPEFLDHPKAVESLIREDRYMASFMSDQGLVSNLPEINDCQSLFGCTIVTAGDELDLGGTMLRFLDAKGHAPGNIIVHVPDSSALLASDSLGYRCPGWGFFPIFFTGYAGYMATIDSIEALRPEILGLAHNGFMRGPEVQKTIQEAREAAEGVMARIVTDRREDEIVVKDLLKDFYRNELTLYSKENILVCCRLLVRRAREYQNVQHINA